MSVASYSNHQDPSLYKKPSIQRRNHSGELDVFEAANYFSASTIYDKDKKLLNAHKPDQPNSKITSSSSDREYRIRSVGARTSVDVPNSRLLQVQPTHTGHSVHSGQNKEEVVKSIKLPSSPGGRLASFLNSLFNNAAAKKNKKSAQDHDHHHQRPRVRRSSMSHVDSSRSTCAASSTATGFRTPPKIYTAFDDDSRSLQDHGRVDPTPDKSQIEIGKNGAKLISLPDQKLIRISDGVSGFDKNRRNSTNGLPEKDNTVDESEFKKGENIVEDFDQFKKVDCTVRADFEFKRSLVEEEDDDDGVESDTSSDLFELQLDDFSSGLLPVYETIKNSPKPSLLYK